MIRFFVRTSLVSFVLLCINFFLLQEVFEIDFTGLFYGMYIYFFSVVSIMHVIMSKALKKRPQQYIVYFMASMGIKIFLSLAILVVILYVGIENSKVFALNYLMLYLLFSALSISQMLNAQKALGKKE